MQFKTGNAEDKLYSARYEFSPYGYGPVLSKLDSIFKELIFLWDEVLEMKDQTREEYILDGVEIEMNF